MATEEQKKAHQLRLGNIIFFGFAKGLYDLFGDSAAATVETVGEDVIEDMEHQMGLEIHGEDPNVVLTEIARLLIDEYGMAKDITQTNDATGRAAHVKECIYWNTTKELQAAGVPPYVCVPRMIALTALHKRGGLKIHVDPVVQDDATHICHINFRLSQ